MGKKTRKTRWRTLSIGTQSDSDSLVNGEEDNTRQKTNQRHGRFQQRFYTQNNNSTPKYNTHYSSHSTPTRQYNNNNNHGYHNKYETSKSTTRSSSTTSENKITFNEEEYTRITTPRQDVLFKKGYLSKPKPYLQQQQQQLTSTGNSTGDGTPDHQSADGTEGGDLGEFEQPPFVFPGSYLDHHSTIYYVNGYEPYAAAAAASASHHPMVMYNPALCYPYVTGAGDASRVKRYSTDSMTDSTSPPSNECQDDVASEFNSIPPCFIYNTAFSPVYDVPPAQSDITPATETTDDCIISVEETNKQNPPLKKKRSRRKSDTENDEIEEECSTDDESKSHDEAGATSTDLDVSSRGSNVPPDVPQVTDTTTTSAKYRVDAEEFVPRAYRATPAALPPGFVSMPLCPDMMFIPPGMMMAPPPGPHFISGRFYDMNPFYQTPRLQEGEDTTTITTTNKEIQDVDENLDKQTESHVEATKQVENDRVIEEEINNDENAVDSSKPTTKQVVPSEKLAGAPPHVIDIAKIVSKLEEAALEQKRLETEAQQPKSKRDEEEISEKSQMYLEMHPRPTTRRAPQHRERRTHLNSINKKSETSVTTERKTNYKTEPATRYTTANCTTEPLLNINNNNKTSSPTVQALAKEHSPSVLPAPLPTFTDKLKSTSRKSTPAKATVVAPCPRLQRVRSRPEPEVRSAKTPVQVVPVAVQPRATAPDAWISVSNKKKRKTKNQDEIEEDTRDKKEETEPIVQEIVIKSVEIEQQQQEPDVQKTEEVVIQMELEMLEDESPIKKQNNNKVKKPRRKIIINDEALLMSGKEVTTTTTTQVVQVEKIPKEVKSKVTTIVESSTPAIVIPHIEVIAIQEALPHVPCSKPKKKKKRINNKVHSDHIVENLDVSASCDDSSSTSTSTTADNFNDAASKTNVEVSLEIDRMIQRGLYANLEEKIRLFNPSDSFIHASTDKDVDANAVMEGFSFDMVKSLESNAVKNNNNNFKNFDFSGILFNGTTINQTLQRAMSTKTVLKSVTTAPNVCYVPKTTSNHQTDDTTTELTVTELVTSPDSIESLTLDEPTTTTTATDSVAHLQITRAVKEWMNRTRENTPEIEIFKNPQELRQEFLLSDVEDDSDETISATREGSADLLECWEEPQVLHEEEHPVAVLVQPEPAIEQGEDALEVYESVYGKNADYLRIKSEVKEAGATPHIPAAATRAPFGVRDGGLPYRAICCTVM